MTPFQHALQPAGPHAAAIAQLWWLTAGICALVFVAVLAAFLYAIWRAPRADAATPPDTASTLRPERRAQVSVASAVAASVAGLLVLLVASVMTDRALAQLPRSGALNIEVVGHQWWWDVHYRFPQPARDFATANEIWVPVGRPVLLTLKADDVIHSFWVPNLAGKKDLIPGNTTTLTFVADREGIYRGQCAEFCGVQHAFMSFYVHAVPAGRFEQWAESQRGTAAEPADEAQRRGRDLFLSGTCMMCHAIQGTPAGGRKAPDLTHVASRGTLAAGRIPMSADSLRAWIRDPQKIKPGVHMPAHDAPAEEIDALVAYLGALK